MELPPGPARENKAASQAAPDWDALPPLRDVIAAHDLRAEKKLGQNFLLDRNITDKIARAACDMAQARGMDFSALTVFEIGPGPGGLTRSLLRAGAGQVIAVEYDRRAVAALQDLVQFAAGRLSVIHADALKTDLLALAPPDAPRMIVANLPYNIATPLLTGWLAQLHDDPLAYAGMVLMFQREVALRLIAAPGGGTYGRLSVITQWLCSARRLFDLPPSAFIPPPKVTSSVVGFTPRTLTLPQPTFGAVEKLTAAAFGQRRKMLRSSLKDYLPLLEAAGIDPALRAENLSVDAYIELARLT